VFDNIRADVAGDRSQFYKDLSAPFYGANRPGSKVPGGRQGGVLALVHASRP
jgi:non-heme chloroperoxidase